MFSPTSARSVQKLFAGFHQPAGISKTQSKKLLDGLKASFRQHLNREHGGSQAEDRGPTAASAKPGINAADGSPASRHLASILDNPLFKLNRTSKPSTSSPPVDDIATIGAVQMQADPMDVFDRAVERGMMNLKAATGCLAAKRQQLNLTRSDKSKPPGQSDVAARVVSWLDGHDEDQPLRFLRHRSFCRALLPFMVEEGMEQKVWTWLHQAMHELSTGGTKAPLQQDTAIFLTELVRIKRQPPHGNLDAAIAIMLQAEQLFAGFPHIYRLLVGPWRSISWMSTVKSYNQEPASEVFFNAHIATAKRLTQPLLVETAHLHLFHPTRPDFRPAFDIFSNQTRLRRIVQDAQTKPRTRSPVEFSDPVPWIAYLGYDTVNHLAKNGRTKEAHGVTELLRHELADLMQQPAPPSELAAIGM